MIVVVNRSDTIQATPPLHIKGLPAANDYRVHIWATTTVTFFYNNTPDWNAATLVDLSGGNAALSISPSVQARPISGTIYHTSADAANVVRNGWVQAMNPQAALPGCTHSAGWNIQHKGAGRRHAVHASGHDS